MNPFIVSPKKLNSVTRSITVSFMSQMRYIIFIDNFMVIIK